MSVQEAPPRRRFRKPDPKYMTFVEHLDELRGRLIKMALAVIAGSVIGWFLTPRVIDLIINPVCKSFEKGQCKLYVDTVYGAFALNLKVAVILGFMFALPITLYQVWAFIAPAFGEKANIWAPIWIFSALLLFLAGATTGYLVIPLALSFFDKFNGNHVETLVFASKYISFIVLILLVFGVSYELPLVLVTLAAAGLTTSQWLWSKRIYFFFGIFATATVVTPGADWISPLILGGILYVLYLGAILVARLMGK